MVDADGRLAGMVTRADALAALVDSVAMERALARVDFEAIRANCARLKAELGERPELCAVIKADGYGHGADGCAAAALAGERAGWRSLPRSRPNRWGVGSLTSRC